MKYPRSACLISFALTLTPSLLAQGSDDCSAAQSIAGPGPHPISLQGSTSSSDVPMGCPSIAMDEDVWFEWTPATSGLYGVDICGGNAAAWGLAIWTDCGSTLIDCLEFNCQNDDRRVLFQGIAGTSYKFQVSSPVFWAYGSLEVVPVVLPENDDCANATELAAYGEYPFDLSGATTDGPPSTQCLFNAFNDVWFRWTSPYARPVFFRVDFPGTQLALIDGCSGTELACSRSSNNFPAGLRFDPQVGQEYLIRISTISPDGRFADALHVEPDQIVIDEVNDRAYSIIQKTLSFQEAQQFAQSYRYRGIPGNLAALTSQAEHDFIHSELQVPQNLGIGLYQDLNDPNYSEPAGAWKWITGEAIFVYQLARSKPARRLPKSRAFWGARSRHVGGQGRRLLRFPCGMGPGLPGDIIL